MVERINLAAPDRATIEMVMKEGLRQSADNWKAARIALARSLRMQANPDPDAYKVLPQQGSAGVVLHLKQLLGEGHDGDEDLTEVVRALLSAYHGINLASDERRYHDLLQQHVRRGLQVIRTEWSPETDFADYLLREVYPDGKGTSADPQEESANLPGRVDRLFGQLGIGGKVLEALDGPRLTQLKVKLRDLADLDRLRRGLDKIAFGLGLMDGTVTSGGSAGERQVVLTIPRPPGSWRTVTWGRLKPSLLGKDAKEMLLPVCVGTDIMGEPFLIDVGAAPHLFIGGTTGSGKSMCLHAIILSLLAAPPETSRLLLIDPKAVELAAYDKSPRLLADGVVTSADAALVGLQDLVSEMDARQAIMRASGARNIDEANAGGAKIPRIVVVVDELGDLFMTRREIETPIIRLAQKARSSGIHLILATQRPEAATFPGLLRSNIPSRIALTVQKASESRIILDEGGAEHLQWKGDMLVKIAGRTTIRAHGCLVSPADIAAAVQRS